MRVNSGLYINNFPLLNDKKKSYVLNVIFKSSLLPGPQGRSIRRECVRLSSWVMSEDWFSLSIVLTTSPHETMWIVITHCSSFSKCIRRNKGKMSRDSWFFKRTLGHDWTLEFTSHTQDQISCLCVPIRTWLHLLTNIYPSQSQL